MSTTGEFIFNNVLIKVIILLRLLFFFKSMQVSETRKRGHNMAPSQFRCFRGQLVHN